MTTPTVADIRRDFNGVETAVHGLRSQQVELGSGMANVSRQVNNDLGDFAKTMETHHSVTNHEMVVLAESVRSYLVEIQGTHEDHTDEAFLRGIAIALVFGVYVLTWTEYRVDAILLPLFAVVILLCVPGVRKALGMHYRKIITRWQHSITAPAKRPVAASATTVTEQTMELRAPRALATNGRHRE